MPWLSGERSSPIAKDQDPLTPRSPQFGQYPPMRRLICIALLLPFLAGCTLLDQTTFAPSPEPKPPTVIVPPKAETRTPLIVIAASATPKDYAKPLREAVRAAEKLKRNIDYDVVGIASIPATPAGKAAASGTVVLEEAGSHAAKVMRAIMALSVPAARIHLGARSDSAITASEIRVYVR